MFYVNDKDLIMSPQVNIFKVLEVLSKAPQDRSLTEHEFVYKSLHNNRILEEIERKKSLNGKMEAIAKLTVETDLQNQHKKDILSRATIIQEIKLSQQDNRTYYIILDNKIKQNILKANEKHLRKQMQQLKKFNLLQDLKYSQLLHLAYYMRETTFNYKQIVYQEGETPRYIYLVQRGQFEICKSSIETENQHNKLRKSQHGHSLGEIKMGIIQGDCGQCFGEEDIIDNTDRQYTVRCLSTDNLVIMIPKDKYEKVFDSSFTQTKIKWMKEKNGRKKQMKKEIYSKIINTKKNYKNYANLIMKNSDLSQRQNSQDDDKKMVRIKLHKNRSVSTEFEANYPKTQSKIASKTLPHEQKCLRSSAHVQKTQTDDEETTFCLTKVDVNEDPIQQSSERSETKPTKQEKKSSEKHQTKLPHIHIKAPQSRTPDPNIHNWSVTRPVLDMKTLGKKHSGIVAISALVAQKQSVMNLKPFSIQSHPLPKQKSYEFFSFEVPQKTKQLQHNHSLMSKKDTRQMRSAVRSKYYMQNLLVEALRRSGYSYQTQPDHGVEMYCNQAHNYRHAHSPSGEVQHKQILHRKKGKSKINKNVQLLGDNAVDRYFKIE